MAHFYGVVKGSRGLVTRLGTKKSSLSTTAASWSGACHTHLYHRSDGVDCVRVTLIPWHGEGITKELYDGPIGKDIG